MSARLETLHPKSGPTQANSTVAEDLADFAHQLKFDDIPNQVLERAKLHMLDAIGTAFVATRYDFARRIHSGLKAFGEDGKYMVLGMK